MDIWIVEEKVTNKFIGNLGHYLRVDGEVENAYNLYAIGDDYVENNKDFLLEFLLHEKRYPLFVTFIVYDDQTDEYTTFLKKNKIEFVLNNLDEKRTYYDFRGKHQYHPPCFTARIEDDDSLALLLNETYWLPAQNEFYSISFSDNLTFESEEVIEWRRKRKRSIASFKIDGNTSFILIEHDGAGFYLLSNEEKYFPLTNFMSSLPKGTVVTQINDTVKR